MIPDPLKAGGRYETVTDQIKRIDVARGKVILRKTQGYGKSNVEMFSILNVSPNEFFGIKGVSSSLSDDERSLLDGYRLLDDIHKEDVIGFVETLNTKSHIRLLKRKYDEMNCVDFRERPAAAGSGSDWDNYTENEPVILYDSGIVSKADEIFIVSGDSMEPQFSDGDRVLVEYCESVRDGDIGIFYAPGYGGLIKQKAYDRLHSLNRAFDDILPYEDGAKVIGRVLGKALSGAG